MEDNKRREALLYHAKPKPGKIKIVPTKNYGTQRDLSLAYSPGVAEPCIEINKDHLNSYKYTNKSNLVAVITNGTAVLGLGDIGPDASKPVMEGKALLFKIFAGIDVFDIEINEKDPEKFIEAVKAISPSFGGINLEDIKSPEAFIIEETLKQDLKIPVMHDDQHGTAIISCAALINAVELVNKNLSNRSINRKVSSLKSFYKFLVKTNTISSSPLLAHSPLKQSKKIQVPFSKEEINSLLDSDSFKGDYRGVLKKTIITFFYFTGVRRIELINLKESDINMDSSITFSTWILNSFCMYFSPFIEMFLRSLIEFESSSTLMFPSKYTFPAGALS